MVVIACSCGHSGAGMSNSIRESKKNGYFICEYQPNKILINDTLQFQIREAWLEKCFFYNEKGNTYDVSGYQLIVLSEGDIFYKTRYNSKWKIGIDWERTFRSCGDDCIMSNLKDIGQDIETWKVQAGTRLDTLVDKKIIGMMTLIKK